MVTNVVTVSPTLASVGSVMVMAIPPTLAASAALTPFDASLKLTAGAVGAVVSSVKLAVAGVLALPAVSVTVVLVVHAPSTVRSVLAMT